MSFQKVILNLSVSSYQIFCRIGARQFQTFAIYPFIEFKSSVRCDVFTFQYSLVGHPTEYNMTEAVSRLFERLCMQLKPITIEEHSNDLIFSQKLIELMIFQGHYMFFCPQHCPYDSVFLEHEI